MKRGGCYLLLLLLLFSGCAKEKIHQEVEGVPSSKALQIGFSFDSYVIERWIRDRDIFVSTATKLGAEVNVQNASGDEEEQIAQIEYLIDKKMDVIVILAVNYKGLEEVVQKARIKGIKVIAYDRQIQGVAVDLFLTFDSVEVGRQMAQYVLNHTDEKGTIGLILGSPEDYNTILIKKGIEEVLKDSQAEVLFLEYASGWNEELGFKVVSELVTDTFIPDGIICGNDNIAGQAIKALAEKKLAGEVLITGQDANTEACQRIVEGTQSMTSYKSVEELSSLAARYAVALGKGEEIYVEQEYEMNGEKVPMIELKPILVTKENMDEVITNQFHPNEDIYRNVEENSIQ